MNILVKKVSTNIDNIIPYLDLAGLCNFDFCHVTAPSIGLIMA